MAAISQTKIVHLAGSVESKFLFELSLMYCKSAWDELSPEFPNSILAIVTPEKEWFITEQLGDDPDSYCEGMMTSLTEKEALIQLKDMGVEVVVPHMFCTEGMTTYRNLMENAGFRLMGNPSDVCAKAQHKHLTKECVKKNNVRVPNGMFIKNISEAPQTVPLPCIVKPCDLDNSVGVKFCRTQEEYERALDFNFNITTDVLIEEYIPGEEVRCGIIETSDGELVALPMIKYLLEDLPIRGMAQKLVVNKEDDQQIKGFATKPHQVQIPAQLSEETQLKIKNMAKKAHEALGCQLYSLYDFRVNDNEVVLLEACLFCSFSPKSVLPTMARAENISAIDFFHNMLNVCLNKERI